MGNHCVYVLRSVKDKKYYVGYSRNISQRIKGHNAGMVSSTKNRRPLKLVYCEIGLSQKDATIREKYLKTAWGKRYIKNRIRNYINNINQ